MILANYSVLLVPGWPLFWWMSVTWLLLNWRITTAQLSGISSPPFLCRSSHLWGTLVRLSAWFWQDFTSVMSIINTYSSTKACSIPKHCLTSISPVCWRSTLDFLILLWWWQISWQVAPHLGQNPVVSGKTAYLWRSLFEIALCQYKFVHRLFSGP